MAEALDAVAGNTAGMGEWREELIGEIAAKHARSIETQAAESKARAEKTFREFRDAVRQVDAADFAERSRTDRFAGEVASAERVARDNLAYLSSNGFLAFGTHFDEFLSAVNRNMLAVYPQADAEIVLPKPLTEKDRALLAHGLVLAI